MLRKGEETGPGPAVKEKVQNLASKFERRVKVLLPAKKPDPAQRVSGDEAEGRRRGRFLKSQM